MTTDTKQTVQQGLQFQDAQTMRVLRKHETLAGNWWCEGVDEAVGVWTYSTEWIQDNPVRKPNKNKST
jgi:hypothetical protein